MRRAATTPSPVSLGASLALTSMFSTMAIAPDSMSIAAPWLKDTDRVSVQSCSSIFDKDPTSRAPGTNTLGVSEGGKREGQQNKDVMHGHSLGFEALVLKEENGLCGNTW